MNCDWPRGGAITCGGAWEKEEWKMKNEEKKRKCQRESNSSIAKLEGVGRKTRPNFVKTAV